MTQEQVHTVLVDVMVNVMVVGELEEQSIVLPSDKEEVAGYVLSNPNWFNQMKSVFQVCIWNISIVRRGVISEPNSYLFGNCVWNRYTK